MISIKTYIHFIWLIVALHHCFAIKELENPGLFEGDIELSPEEREEVIKGTYRYASISDRSKLWPKTNGVAVIPYMVDWSISYYDRAMKELKIALEEYHKYTCIRFVERKNNEKHYIEFHNGRGCSSPVGRECYDGTCNKHNRVSLAEGCWWRGIMMHEIGHSIGLHHEQTRPDRDEYIEVIKDNVYPSMVFNFDKQKKSDIDSLGTKYDYLSIMHYHWNAFGRGQRMTMKTKDPRYQYLIGQWETFSEIDQIQINKLYRCSGNYPKVPKFVMPPPNCYDTSNSCLLRRLNGACTTGKWQRFMKKKCRKACGFCGGGNVSPPSGKTTSKPVTDSGSCRDLVRNCNSLGNAKCKASGGTWKRFMDKNCRKYCNFC